MLYALKGIGVNYNEDVWQHGAGTKSEKECWDLIHTSSSIIQRDWTGRVKETFNPQSSIPVKYFHQQGLTS